MPQAVVNITGSIDIKNIQGIKTTIFTKIESQFHYV